MAEAVVSFIIDRLGEQLNQQASSLVGVKDQVEDLRRELLWIQSFLQDADSRQDESSVVRNWVSEIRDAAYDIEDIIDTYILKVEDEDVLDHPPTKRRLIMGYIKKYAGISQKGANLYSIGKEVENVKSRIRHTGQAMQNYGIRDFGSRGGDRIKPFSQEIFQQLRRCSPYDDAIAKGIVGLDEKAEELVVELLKEEYGCRCISITGMGGIGKTTLATKIYKCEEVHRHFDCCAWANVSKEFNVKSIFKTLIKKVKPNLSTEELQEMEMFDDVFLQDKLRAILEGRTYLVVLDDIWDVEAWVSLKRAFPQHCEKGRVILTSRNMKVARESVIHQLPTLNETDSWKLFVVKAFDNDDCPANLEVFGKEMVKKCDGLPLAISVLAGLLRGKSPQRWFIVRDRFHQQLMKGQGENNLEKILSLSYDDLPYQLKACYLCTCLFPEDEIIIARGLISLWVAEGFIRCERDEIVEDVARDYLNELINRSMLTVLDKDKLGEVESCGIHDLLRDICISKGQEEKFLDYYPVASSSSSSTTGIVCKSRRYAIHFSGIERFDFSNLSNSHLRTLLLFTRNAESLHQQQLESISNIRLLKVLDLSGINFQGKRLPDAFGKLIHLRYLNLLNAKAKLPSSIESLQSLQTLNLWASDCHWSDIANGALTKLTQLRHLFLSNEYWNGLDREVGLPRIDTLTNLQRLTILDARVWQQNTMTNLINLQQVGIRNIGASNVESVLSSIGKLDKIKDLHLELSKASSMPIRLSHCHHLQMLALSEKIEKLPEFPPTSRLTKLLLRYSMLGPKAMAILEKLPNLIFLCLWDNSIMGKKIVCSAQGFPQLRLFDMRRLEIEEWEIKKGALPKLNRLNILDCSNMKKIPMGLRFVATLHNFKLYSTSAEFQDRFDKGEDAMEIGHIPSIETNWTRRLLKVLELSDVNFQGKRLPDAFEKLIHLRYLKLQNVTAKLPSTIESLQSLQTLELWWSDCHWSDIAIGALSKLKQLRHLLLSNKYWDGLDRGVGLPRIDTLTNLQTLRIMDALVWKQNETTNLINLRDLRIINIRASDVESVLSSICKLDKIKILSLELSKVGSPEYAFQALVHLFHCNHLQNLKLFGKIERLPKFPPTSRLTELFLCNSRLGSEAMEILEKLPNLILLSLWKNSIMGKKIVYSAQGFPQLRVFKIFDLEIDEWEFKEGALPKLNCLNILECCNLKKIPKGLRFVVTLQVLVLYPMSLEFRGRFHRGEYAHEIGHIPSIITDWMRR